MKFGEAGGWQGVAFLEKRMAPPRAQRPGKDRCLGGTAHQDPWLGLLGPRCEQEWERDAEFQASGGLEVPFHVFCKTDS